jgi:hypothetical protein
MTAPWAGDNAAGGVVAPPLLNDDDYNDFASLDLDWFLSAVGKTIRDFLGWHLAPSITETLWVDQCGDGTILLPTRHLTGVTSVTPTFPGATAISSTAYQWDRRGWIDFHPYGFAPNPSSAWPIDTVHLFDAYPKRDRRVIVEFTHGYPNLPYSVAEVGNELVMRAMEKPSGVANQVQAGPFRFAFNEFGIVMSEDQKSRLSQYKLPGVR